MPTYPLSEWYQISYHGAEPQSEEWFGLDDAGYPCDTLDGYQATRAGYATLREARAAADAIDYADKRRRLAIWRVRRGPSWEDAAHALVFTCIEKV